MNEIRGAIENTIPISMFNKGLAGKIFSDVRAHGSKVVMKNNAPECVLISPDEYIKLMDEVNDARLLSLAAAELELGYRHSCVPERKYIVVEATMELSAKPEEEIRACMAELRAKRVEKQPLEYPSAGSTFKRPEGYFAGKLIMDAGLRGYTVGGAQVSEKHCGFVINKGGATAADVRQLMQDVHDRVKEQFDVELEPEVKMIGSF